MRVTVSLLAFRPGQIGGAETYVRRIVAALVRRREPGDRVTLVACRDIADALAVADADLVVIPRSARHVMIRRAAEACWPFRALAVERTFRSLNPDVTFFPQQSIFPRCVPGPVVLSVMDVQHLYLPGNFSWPERLFRAIVYSRSLRRADRIIAISEFTRRSLLERCGVRADMATTVPFGFDRPSVAAAADSASGERIVESVGDATSAPYLYYPAATFPHKNHLGLLEVAARLVARDRFPYRLVFSGLKTSGWAHIERRISELGLEHRVEHRGFVSSTEVQRLYAGAAAVVFPTQFEGFGLPVLEAVSHGKKVITSRLPVFDEIGVPAAFQIDFADEHQFATALALAGPTLLERPPITWDESADATWRVFRSAVRRG